jgi:hypothetical protein
VRFEALVPADARLFDCDCSMCARVGFLHLILPRDRFRLLAGDGLLTEYRFHTGVARHLFCRVCGVKSFYVPRSNPEGVSVNARCLDAPLAHLPVVPFNGKDWERSVHLVEGLA